MSGAVSKTGMTGARRRLLDELADRAQPPETDCWLIDSPVGNYALIVQTIIGDNKYKLTTSATTVAALHEAGHIAYSVGEHKDLEYERDGSLHTATVATLVRITKAGQRALRDSKKEARHRKAAVR